MTSLSHILRTRLLFIILITLVRVVLGALQMNQIFADQFTSRLCRSVNNVIVHGIPDEYVNLSH